jgi:apolipoprotein N-acyltransferase
VSSSALPDWGVTPTQSRDSALGLRVFIAACLGAITVLAFAPFSYSALWLLIFAGLAWLWQSVGSMRGGFLTGYVFGLAQFGFGVSWVHISMHRFGGASLIESGLLTGLFVAFLAFYPAFVGLLYVVLRRSVARFLLPVLFALLWSGGEFLRSTLFTGFPWLLAGVAQVDGLWNPLLPLIGAPFTGALLALMGSASGLLFQSYRALPSRGHGIFLTKPSTMRAPLWVLGPVLAVFSLMLPLFLLKSAPIRSDVGEVPKISVRLLQYGVTQDQKWRNSQRIATLEWYREQTARAGADLVIWPETAVPAFASDVSSYLHQIQEISLSNDSGTILGVVRDEAGGYTNALLGYGRAQGYYEKRHLVPFGEYIPLKTIFSPIIDILNIPMSDFSAGNADQAGITFDGDKVGSSICYEVAYPGLVEQGSAGFLITVSNDAWFGDSWAADQHLQIARARAAERGLAMLRATNSGITAVIGERGEVVASLPRGVPGVLEWELPLYLNQPDRARYAD